MAGSPSNRDPHLTAAASPSCVGPVQHRDHFTFFFGADSEIIEERYAATFGARLAVIDVPRGADIRRYLASLSENGLVTQQSAMSLMRPERLIFAYERVMAVAVAVVPKPRTVLLLGLGGGTMMRFLSAYFPDCALTVVEHDPAIIALARRHFHIDHPIELADAVEFIATTTTRFDAIFVDIYGASGFNGPPAAFWERCAAILAPKGCIAINWADVRDKAIYRTHARRAAKLTGRSFYLAPNGFKDNVVQLCSTDSELDHARLRERATWLGRLQRRQSPLQRCAILDDFP
jgi:spermidine synthase